MTSPREALLAAVVDLIKADPSIAAFPGLAVGAELKVFDQVPEATAGPYVYVGPINFTRLAQGDCGRAATVRLRIFAVSVAFGRLEAADLGFLVAAALDGVTPALGPGLAATSLEVVQDGDVIEPIDPKAVFIDLETVVQWAT